MAYQFHEFHADGYNIVNDVLSRIEPLAMTQEQALRESVRANLAESNLTVGRYDDAIAIAEDLVAQPSADRSTVLNMKYMLFAALTLKGDRPRADQALADLNSYLGTIPEDFSNTWSIHGHREVHRSRGPGAGQAGPAGDDHPHLEGWLTSGFRPFGYVVSGFSQNGSRPAPIRSSGLRCELETLNAEPHAKGAGHEQGTILSGRMSMRKRLPLPLPNRGEGWHAGRRAEPPRRSGS